MRATLSREGYRQHNIWEHSSIVRELYKRRARAEEVEMTCAAQAAELLLPLAHSGDSLLDAGCGSGYFFHSLRTRNIPLEYRGIDAAASLIEIGKQELPTYGLPEDRLEAIRIEDLGGSVDHVLCLNVLSNIDNYHRPLERFLQMAGRSVIIRESMSNHASYRYVVDKYLDAGKELKVHVNTYETQEVIAFIESHGYSTRLVTDKRTGGEEELVIGYPHYWKFIVAVKKT